MISTREAFLLCPVNVSTCKCTSSAVAAAVVVAAVVAVAGAAGAAAAAAADAAAAGAADGAAAAAKRPYTSLSKSLTCLYMFRYNSLVS
ncbi:unnamed protein product [Danaus chrysippus]|uniref:(African queen) hypothetical protein n=1 Tax=Danaus chrysippus TaxID=151541 RepID=A0A8J2W5M8_9NEOP|nr:unnamed protein product [Danaus chrysippus]